MERVDHVLQRHRYCCDVEGCVWGQPHNSCDGGANAVEQHRTIVHGLPRASPKLVPGQQALQTLARQPRQPLRSQRSAAPPPPPDRNRQRARRLPSAWQPPQVQSNQGGQLSNHVGAGPSVNHAPQAPPGTPGPGPTQGRQTPGSPPALQRCVPETQAGAADSATKTKCNLHHLCKWEGSTLELVVHSNTHHTLKCAVAGCDWSAERSLHLFFWQDAKRHYEKAHKDLTFQSIKCGYPKCGETWIKTQATSIAMSKEKCEMMGSAISKHYRNIHQSKDPNGGSGRWAPETTCF